MPVPYHCMSLWCLKPLCAICRWAKSKRVNVEDIEELRSLRPMAPIFSSLTLDLQEKGSVPVGTKISIMPDSRSAHGVRIYFRHLTHVEGDEVEEASKLHDLELRINHKKKPGSPHQKSGAENSRAEISLNDNIPTDDNHYKLYTGPFEWRTGGRHSFRAICINDFQLISSHTTLTRRFDGQIAACYLQV